jgi:glycosyltransferase involved in cell wall biosynthesis
MQANKPLITAVIPTYRRPNLLRRAIRSVLAQTYGHLVVSVYDNASDDDTASMIAALAHEDARVKYHRHLENIGMVANFAYGMEHVETPYFSMLSDDDYYHPEFYDTAMNGFARYPDAMFSAGTTILAYDNGRIQMGTPVEGYFPPPDGFLLWTRGRGPAVTSMVFRREVITQAGVADTCIFHWDVEYLWRLVSQFPFVTSARPGLIFTIPTDQRTRHSALDVVLQSYEIIRARVQSTAGPSKEVRLKTERFLRAWFSQAVLHAGLRAICDGEFHRSQYAAAVLHTYFGQKRRAAILDLLAQTCIRMPLVSWPTRAATSALIRTGTYVYQSGHYRRSHPAAFADIERLVRYMHAENDAD